MPRGLNGRTRASGLERSALSSLSTPRGVSSARDRPRDALFDTELMTQPLWLLLDADDTLWENNIFFEETIEEFIAFVDHSALSPAEVREALDQVEACNIKKNGYGSENFTNNLIECFENLRGRPATPDERIRLHAMTDRIRKHPIRLMPDVLETLAELGDRHHLALVSKGDRAEQIDKLDRSGLKKCFEHYYVVHEKDAACYRSIVREIGIDADQAWMIGNSPKSDIHPALEAGLGAVFVPHPSTWSLEVRPLPDPSDRFRVVERFRDLASIF